MQPLHRILDHDYYADTPAPSDAAVCSTLGIPGFDTAVAVQRLLLLGRIIRHGPQPLWSLLQSPSGAAWRKRVLQDCSDLAVALCPKLDALGCPTADWPDWQRFIWDYPQAWKRHVKEFSRCSVTAPEATPSPPRAFACSECTSRFPSQRALKAHQAAKHGRRRLSSSYIADGRCPFCTANFHTRLRCLAHVDRGSLRCRMAMLAGAAPVLTDAQIAAAEANDRAVVAAAKRAGTWSNSGPPAIPPANGWTKPKLMLGSSV